MNKKIKNILQLNKFDYFFLAIMVIGLIYINYPKDYDFKGREEFKTSTIFLRAFNDELVHSYRVLHENESKLQPSEQKLLIQSSLERMETFSNQVSHDALKDIVEYNNFIVSDFALFISDSKKPPKESIISWSDNYRGLALKIEEDIIYWAKLDILIKNIFILSLIIFMFLSYSKREHPNLNKQQKEEII